jgi:hypothetical protein
MFKKGGKSWIELVVTEMHVVRNEDNVARLLAYQPGHQPGPVLEFWYDLEGRSVCDPMGQPIVVLANAILQTAIQDSHGEILIEPDDEKVSVSYGSAESLHPTMTLPNNLRDSLITRLKIMANISIRIPRRAKALSR